MNRLRLTLDACRARGEKAMGLFLTNGFPTPESTLPILRAIDDAGADFIELGMPFSDPLAEGPTIQYASERALAQGTTLRDCFRMAESFRATSATPLVLMGYANPVFRYGWGNFCRDARSAGVDGIILPDLPPEEASDLRRYAAKCDLAVIFLISPNTPPERVKIIDQLSTGFVYAVSTTGLTGSDLGDAPATEAYLRRAWAIVEANPLLVGFGIKTPDDAARLSPNVDGFIVGSELIRRVDALWNDTEMNEDARLSAVATFARALKSQPIRSLSNRA